jgi:multimeric flavodoxin WrbA
MSSFAAVALNCTLKPSPATSNTGALLQKVLDLMAPLGVSHELIRVVDHEVKFGVSNDEGDGDAWPGILEKVKAADILVVGTPIWFGARSSVCQLVMERLDATLSDTTNDLGHYPLYNKVAGCVVTGNEDGAHHCCSDTLFNLTHLGCVVPPNADCYWVGEAGPGPNYLDAGTDHLYTNKTARFMAHNLVAVAAALKASPIQTDLNALQEQAKAESSS